MAFYTLMENDSMLTTKFVKTRNVVTTIIFIYIQTYFHLHTNILTYIQTYIYKALTDKYKNSTINFSHFKPPHEPPLLSP